MVESNRLPNFRLTCFLLRSHKMMMGGVFNQRFIGNFVLRKIHCCFNKTKAETTAC